MKTLATVFISPTRLCRCADSLCLPGSSLCKPVLSVQFSTGKYDSENDKPIDMPDPYLKPKKKCFICEKNIPLDYKNVRLLSQFVSPYTGRIYGRHITGMCIPMQKRISQLITRSRQFGFMPFESKETVFISDPKIPAPSRIR
ncbi:28S ribosomal protein S18c isoform 1 [Schistosoma japonicum]|uniref:28S ribosomal protein S18c isoform 1 n=1 Tax=Schistosoma japonicum TaxID=6182 RepID=C1LJJ7_SCHJA|nr:28S ribosomal protein S18c isoform 1 [Schistosoma japonicum]CAX74873.1 putative 28S ribosomal protein S18c, mitochondrial precursor [Schistosoma japonicum]CAX74874.1 putative 28S ribosomal protein S18c, mitochondrial precursor [Schistosoma japonicum]CAX74875.1 putative 28S ribosomal protein S18c, mitochondrial precursor [Schistosoma japonicum]CAX74876.1 putative 28S ribosomal protein S18c, mitochondrial precursor [Schistosoma japonicum]